MPLLKKELQRLQGDKWEEDYHFFRGQLKYPQEGGMSPSTDRILEAKNKKRAEREAKAQSFKEKHTSAHCDEVNSSYSTTSKEEELHTSITESNIIPKCKRNSAKLAASALQNLITANDPVNTQGIAVEEGEEWVLPALASR